MHPDPRQAPTAPGPDDVASQENLAEKTYPVVAREGADVPDLQHLLDAYTDQDKPEPAPDATDEEAQKGHS